MPTYITLEQLKREVIYRSKLNWCLRRLARLGAFGPCFDLHFFANQVWRIR